MVFHNCLPACLMITLLQGFNRRLDFNLHPTHCVLKTQNADTFKKSIGLPYDPKNVD